MNRIFESWFTRQRLYIDVPLNSQITVTCNLWDGVQFAMWWAGEHYELKETRYFKSLLGPGAVVLDVGANVGYYSLVAATVVGPEGRVHCFEPVRAQFLRLQENIRRNNLPQVSAHNVALSDKPGTAVISMDDPHNTGGASLRPPPGNVAARETVSITTLDIFTSENPLPRLDVIKMDVEGFESYVLRGGAQTIRRFRPPVMIEIVDYIQRQAGSSRKELYEFFAGLDYAPFRIQSDESLEPIRQPEDGTLIVFLPKEKESRATVQ